MVADALGCQCGSVFHVIWNQERESAGLEETFFEQNRLLTERLGADCESSLGRRGWRFPWGCVTSLLDGKTGECIIWAEYLREQL